MSSWRSPARLGVQIPLAFTKGNMAKKELKQYEFEVISTVIKRCTVEAFSESEAKVKMDDWDVIDEQDMSMTDWGVTKGPDLIC